MQREKWSVRAPESELMSISKQEFEQFVKVMNLAFLKKKSQPHGPPVNTEKVYGVAK